jgi:hypothetical protein
MLLADLKASGEHPDYAQSLKALRARNLSESSSLAKL